MALKPDLTKDPIGLDLVQAPLGPLAVSMEHEDLTEPAPVQSNQLTVQPAPTLAAKPTPGATAPLNIFQKIGESIRSGFSSLQANLKSTAAAATLVLPAVAQTLSPSATPTPAKPLVAANQAAKLANPKLAPVVGGVALKANMQNGPPVKPPALAARNAVNNAAPKPAPPAPDVKSKPVAQNTSNQIETLPASTPDGPGVNVVTKKQGPHGPTVISEIRNPAVHNGPKPRRGHHQLLNNALANNMPAPNNKPSSPKLAGTVGAPVGQPQGRSKLLTPSPFG